MFKVCTCEAAEYESFECLKYAIENDCPYDVSQMLDILEHAYENMRVGRYDDREDMSHLLSSSKTYRYILQLQ